MKKLFVTVTLLAAAINAAVIGNIGEREAAACNQPGGACFLVTRTTEAFATALDEHDAALLARGSKRCDPELSGNHCNISCTEPGHSCSESHRRAEALASAVAEANPDQDESAFDIAARFNDDESDGQLARRAAEAVLDTIAGNANLLEARGRKVPGDYDNISHYFNFCGKAGNPCFKALRSIEAMEKRAREIVDDYDGEDYDEDDDDEEEEEQ